MKIKITPKMVEAALICWYGEDWPEFKCVKGIRHEMRRALKAALAASRPEVHRVKRRVKKATTLKPCKPILNANAAYDD